MWVAQLDELCPPEQAEDIADTIGDAVKYFKTIPSAQHDWFASANKKSFIKDVIDQLKTGYEKPETKFV